MNLSEMDFGEYDDEFICPICCEDLEEDDLATRYCECKFMLCGFCYSRINEDDLPRCPGCRVPYDPSKRVYDQEGAKDLILRFQNKKAIEKQRTSSSVIPLRMNLANKRVIQKNLIYLTNLPLKYSSEEALRKCGVLTRFGKVIKCVVNKRPSTTTTNATCCAHITYETLDEAYDALNGLNGLLLDGKHLKAQYGTTKYCTMYLKNEKCPNPNCMYLHELGDDGSQDESSELDFHTYYNSSQSKSTLLKPASPINRPGSIPEHRNKMSKMESGKGPGSALPPTAAWGRGVTPTTPPSNSPSSFPSLSSHSPQDTPRFPAKTLRIVSSKTPTSTTSTLIEKPADSKVEKPEKESTEKLHQSESEHLSDREPQSTATSSPNLSHDQDSSDQAVSPSLSNLENVSESSTNQKNLSNPLSPDTSSQAVEIDEPDVSSSTDDVDDAEEAKSSIPVKPLDAISAAPSLLDLFLNNSDRQSSSETPITVSDSPAVHPMVRNIPDLYFDRKSISIPPSSQPNLFNPFESNSSSPLSSRQSSIAKLSIRDPKILQPPQGQFSFSSFKNIPNFPSNLDFSNHRSNVTPPTHVSKESGYPSYFNISKLLDEDSSNAKRIQSPPGAESSRFAPNMFRPDPMPNPGFPNRFNPVRPSFSPLSPQPGNSNLRPHTLGIPNLGHFPNPSVQPPTGLSSTGQFAPFPSSSPGIARPGFDTRNPTGIRTSLGVSDIALHAAPGPQMHTSRPLTATDRINMGGIPNRPAFDAGMQIPGYFNESSHASSSFPHKLHASQHLNDSPLSTASVPNMPPGLLRKPGSFAHPMNQTTKPLFDPKLRQQSASSNQSQLDVLADVCQDMSQTSSPTKTPPFNPGFESNSPSRASNSRTLPPGLHPPNYANSPIEVNAQSNVKLEAPPGLLPTIANADPKLSTQGIPINLEQFFSGSLPPGLIPPKKMPEFSRHQQPPGINLPVFSSTSINPPPSYIESPSAYIPNSTPSVSNIQSTSPLLPTTLNNDDSLPDITNQSKSLSNDVNNNSRKKSLKSTSPITSALSTQPSAPSVRKVLVLKDNNLEQPQHIAQPPAKVSPVLESEVAKPKATPSTPKTLTKAEKQKEKEKEKKLKQKEKELEKEKERQRLKELELERQRELERERLKKIEKQKAQTKVEKESALVEPTTKLSGKKSKGKSTPEISKESLQPAHKPSTPVSSPHHDENIIIPLGFGEEANLETNTLNQMSKKQRKKWKAQEKARLEAEAKSDSSLLINFSNEDPIYSGLPYFKNNQQDPIPSLTIPNLNHTPISDKESALGIELNSVVDEVLYHQYSKDDKTYADAHRDIISNVQKDKSKWTSLDKYLGLSKSNSKDTKNPAQSSEFGDDRSVQTVFNTLYGSNPFAAKLKSDATHHISFDFTSFPTSRDHPVNLKRFLDIRQPQDPSQFITTDARSVSTLGLSLNDGLELLYTKAEATRYQQQVEEMVCFKVMEENTKLFCPNI